MKPTGGDVTLDFAAAFPVPTVTTTVSQTTNELTATIEALTGLSLR